MPGKAKPAEPLVGSNPLPSGVITGNPVPRPNDPAEPVLVLPTVDEAYDKTAGEFSGGASVGLPTLAFPHTEGGASDGGGKVGPHELLAHENMRRMYATDPADALSGSEVAGNTSIG